MDKVGEETDFHIESEPVGKVKIHSVGFDSYLIKVDGDLRDVIVNAICSKQRTAVSCGFRGNIDDKNVVQLSEE